MMLWVRFISLDGADNISSNTKWCDFLSINKVICARKSNSLVNILINVVINLTFSECPVTII